MLPQLQINLLKSFSHIFPMGAIKFVASSVHKIELLLAAGFGKEADSQLSSITALSSVLCGCSFVAYLNFITHYSHSFVHTALPHSYAPLYWVCSSRIKSKTSNVGNYWHILDEMVNFIRNINLVKLLFFLFFQHHIIEIGFEIPSAFRHLTHFTLFILFKGLVRTALLETSTAFYSQWNVFALDGVIL